MLPTEAWRAEFDERSPIYIQIINRFSHALVRGEIKPGERIPSIREMALVLKVNSNTMQRAYQEMERGGLIFSQRGTGYFVMRDENMVGKIKTQMIEDSIKRFIEEMRLLGFEDEEILGQLKKEMEGGKSNAAAECEGA